MSSYSYSIRTQGKLDYPARYKKTGEYILLGNCIEPIYLDTITNEKYYAEANEFMVAFNPILDNPVLDMQQVIDRYPEVLI